MECYDNHRKLGENIYFWIWNLNNRLARKKKCQCQNFKILHLGDEDWNEMMFKLKNLSWAKDVKQQFETPVTMHGINFTLSILLLVLNLISILSLFFLFQLLLLEEGWRELFILGAAQWQMSFDSTPLMNAAGRQIVRLCSLHPLLLIV